jgi:hypothetical protein
MERYYEVRVSSANGVSVMKYKEPEFTEDDLVREHMGLRGEKPEDPSQPPPEGNTRPEFVYPPFVGWNTDNGIQNANGGKPWSKDDVWDLRNWLAQGRSIEEVADLLCRHGTLDEVSQKADELRLRYRSSAKR